MNSTLRSRVGIAGRIVVVTIGLLTPLAAILAQPGPSTAGKAWNSPVHLVVAGGTTSTTPSPNGKAWN